MNPSALNELLNIWSIEALSAWLVGTHLLRFEIEGFQETGDLPPEVAQRIISRLSDQYAHVDRVFQHRVAKGQGRLRLKTPQGLIAPRALCLQTSFEIFQGRVQELIFDPESATDFEPLFRLIVSLASTRQLVTAIDQFHRWTLEIEVDRTAGEFSDPHADDLLTVIERQWELAREELEKRRSLPSTSRVKDREYCIGSSGSADRSS